ncbi:MAG: hypothetical protein AB7Q37_15865 [Pyrinomonadaceae bacterium]
MKIIFFLFLVFAASPAFADPQTWSVNSRGDVLKGDARNVSIRPNGSLALSPKLATVYSTDQPYVWSSAIDAAGNVYLGTGGDGQIFKVSPAGSGSMFADLAELNVTAIAVASNGELFASTAPGGKVYRIDQAGRNSVYFDPKEKYIWALAVMNDGSLVVGTGESGKLYRVRGANASPSSSVIFDSIDSHIISLAIDRNGVLYAGTDPGGLVLRFAADGSAFAVLDSPLREIHELAAGVDGSIYALALGESASTAAPSPSPTPGASDSRTVSVPRAIPVAPTPAAKSKYDLTGARSAVYRITADGENNILWSSPTVTGFSLYAHQTGNGVLLGTSDKGRIYNITNTGQEALALQTDASQISTIFARGSDLYATSSNQGVLYKIGPDTVAEGTYESAVLDARSVAAWGRIWWRSTGQVEIQTRSGNSETPEATWSQWSAVRGPSEGPSGSPRARYFQWRAILRSSATPATVSDVNLAFLPANIAPEVLSVQILPVNVGLAANPPVQIDPNIELSGLDPVTFGIPAASVAPRRVYQRAARSFQWTAEDRNGDKLVYDIYFREVREESFKLVRENVSENFVTLDGQSLPDGRYVLRIVARDAPDNPSDRALSGELVTEPFDVDNSQPAVTAGEPQISGGSARIVFIATDRSGHITRAEYSVNGGPWQAVFADDGIADSAEERFSVQISSAPAGEHIVTLRVFDASGNAGNARAVVRR